MKRLRSILACGAAAALVVAGAAVASADDIYNDLSTNIDAVAEVMPLNVGDSGHTSLLVRMTNGDGQNNCNLNGNRTLTVTVFSDNDDVATVSPSNITFRSCDDSIPLTVSANAVGDATITLTNPVNGTKGSFDLTTATFVVNVSAPPPSNTAPSLIITGVDQASYEYGQDPKVLCEVTDKEDGPSSFPAEITAGTDVVDGIGTFTASCDHTDHGGLNVKSSVTYTVTKIPTTVKLTCPTDAVTYTGSPLGPCTATLTGRDLPEGAAATITYDNNTNAGPAAARASYAGDAHHAAATDDTGGFTIGKASSNVTITCTPGSVYTGDALTPCTATATGAGMEPVKLTVDYGNNTNATTETSKATASASWAGDDNHNGNSDSTTFEIAKADSTVALTCPDAVWFTGNLIEPCSATVSGDGVLTGAAVIGYSNNKLAGTATATATYAGDENHNPAEPDGKTFTIKGFDLSSFYKPVDMGMLNTVKAGSTVPLKFELFLNGVEQTSTAAVQGFSTKAISCSTALAAEDPIEVLSTGGTSLRYDTTGGQFIQNWQTPKAAAGSCYRVTMTTIDGAGAISADFKLK